MGEVEVRDDAFWGDKTRLCPLGTVAENFLLRSGFSSPPVAIGLPLLRQRHQVRREVMNGMNS
jgi:hypothetical protein